MKLKARIVFCAFLTLWNFAGNVSSIDSDIHQNETSAVAENERTDEQSKPTASVLLNHHSNDSDKRLGPKIERNVWTRVSSFRKWWTNKNSPTASKKSLAIENTNSLQASGSTGMENARTWYDLETESETDTDIEANGKDGQADMNSSLHLSGGDEDSEKMMEGRRKSSSSSTFQFGGGFKGSAVESAEEASGEASEDYVTWESLTGEKPDEVDFRVSSQQQENEERIEAEEMKRENRNETATITGTGTGTETREAGRRRKRVVIGRSEEQEAIGEMDGGVERSGEMGTGKSSEAGGETGRAWWKTAEGSGSSTEWEAERDPNRNEEVSEARKKKESSYSTVADAETRIGTGAETETETGTEVGTGTKTGTETETEMETGTGSRWWMKPEANGNEEAGGSSSMGREAGGTNSNFNGNQNDVPSQPQSEEDLDYFGKSTSGTGAVSTTETATETETETETEGATELTDESVPLLGHEELEDLPRLVEDLVEPTEEEKDEDGGTDEPLGGLGAGLGFGEWRTGTSDRLPAGTKKPCGCPVRGVDGRIGKKREECIWGELGDILREENSAFKAHKRRRGTTFPTLASLRSSSLNPKTLRRHYLEFYGTPLWPCAGEERVGKWGEGGKWVCRPERLNESSVVYSIGSNFEYSFELDIYTLTGAKPFTFDHTLTEPLQQKMRSLSFLTFVPWGLSNETKMAEHLYSISDIMQSQSHTFVDVLKVDCEGCEISFIDNLWKILGAYKKGNRVLFGQILIEYHNLYEPKVMIRQFAIMEAIGYVPFHVEPNYQCNDCLEMGYIHKSVARNAGLLP